MPDLATELLPAADASATGAPRDLLDLSELHGWGQLTPREQRFARWIVAGMSQRAAALAAGCTGEPHVIDVLASRLAAKPSVRMVITQALHRAGSDLSETITKLTRAQARAYDAWENAPTREERAEAWRVLKESSALLIGIHARASLTVSGNVSHAHAHIHGHTPEAVTASALSFLAQIRRQVVEDRLKAGGELPPPKEASCTVGLIRSQ
jgi:hypothetical protein